MKKWLVLLLVVSAAACRAESPEMPAMLDVSDCSDISASAQVDDCLHREKLSSQAVLDAGVSQFEAYISDLYEADSALGEQLIEMVTEAQQAWLLFRDANCMVEAFEAEEGTPLQQSLINSCVARMNAERTGYLDRLLR